MDRLGTIGTGEEVDVATKLLQGLIVLISHPVEFAEVAVELGTEDQAVLGRRGEHIGEQGDSGLEWVEEVYKSTEGEVDGAF